ncbi:hypothetical protein GGR50DRAFT_639901 [Xylaria sp. CBS 124048]|nr:hypothetical protein GGR50DRAFT_639901 [Xylaria sp. CBS 124048]
MKGLVFDNGLPLVAACSLLGKLVGPGPDTGCFLLSIPLIGTEHAVLLSTLPRPLKAKLGHILSTYLPLGLLCLFAEKNAIWHGRIIAPRGSCPGTSAPDCYSPLTSRHTTITISHGTPALYHSGSLLSLALDILYHGITTMTLFRRSIDDETQDTTPRPEWLYCEKTASIKDGIIVQHFSGLWAVLFSGFGAFDMKSDIPGIFFFFFSLLGLGYDLSGVRLFAWHVFYFGEIPTSISGLVTLESLWPRYLTLRVSRVV